MPVPDIQHNSKETGQRRFQKEVPNYQRKQDEGEEKEAELNHPLGVPVFDHVSGEELYSGDLTRKEDYLF